MQVGSTEDRAWGSSSGDNEDERDGDVGGMRWDCPRGVNCTGSVIRAAPSNF